MKKRTNFSIRIAACFVIVFLFVSIFQINLKLNNIKKETEDIEDQIKRCDSSIEELTLAYEAPMTEDYIKKIAEKRLNFLEPGAIIFASDLTN